MEAGFWHQKWEEHDIGFHESGGNTLLVENFDKLKLAPGSRVFLPLCGKTLDIAWLLAQGYRVAGAELSRVAIDELFEELGLGPEKTTSGPLTHYRAGNIDIFAGDLFDLSAEILGPVDVVYDRAALVALPADTRVKYTAHLRQLTGAVPQLLITFTYDQAKMDGPPFSVPEQEVRQHYENAFHVQAVTHRDVEGGLKGQAAATENLWLLRQR